MGKQILIIMLFCVFSIVLVGCSSETTEVVQVNVSYSESLSSDQFGQFIEIGNDLVYDSATRIVYKRSPTYCADVYTPYCAPNGLPYRYNPETNTFEEIVNE